MVEANRKGIAIKMETSLIFCTGNNGKELTFHREYFEKQCDYGYPEKCKEIAVLGSPRGFNKFPDTLYSCRKHIKPMFGGFVYAGFDKNYSNLITYLRKVSE